jgi:hypothetical protein
MPPFQNPSSRVEQKHRTALSCSSHASSSHVHATDLFYIKYFQSTICIIPTLRKQIITFLIMNMIMWWGMET